jgi:hypothetical protein
MFVKTVFQAVCPATFEVIRLETNPSSICDFWDYYCNNVKWLADMMNSATSCDYEKLKKQIEYILPASPLPQSTDSLQQNREDDEFRVNIDHGSLAEALNFDLDDEQDIEERLPPLVKELSVVPEGE